MFNALPVLLKDFYKSSHPMQYPSGTSLVYSNMTARGSRIPGINKVVLFGPQFYGEEFLIRQFNTNFFKQPKDKVIKQYRRRMMNALGNQADTEYIAALHDLGYLPIEIKCLPEGTRVPIRTPFLTINSTHPDFAWNTNSHETLMSTTLWGMITSATIADAYKQVLKKYALKTSDIPEFVQWQGHDFSMRGMFGVEAAMMSGAAHLLSFWGTDTIPAIDFLEEYYGADSDKELIGGSVPATEHSVMCFGDPSNEYDTYKRLATEVYPSGIVSIVSDTWDYWKIITETLPALKDVIMMREGKLVVRPDSGDPVDIICGINSRYSGTLEEFNNEFKSHGYISQAQWKGSIELLWETFGGVINSKDYRQLDPHIGLIYGDAITMDRNEEICKRLESKKFASTNVVEGIGSYSYQYNTRDTFHMAVKSTAGIVNGKPINIYKKPKTDNGTKNSATGLLFVDNDLNLHEQVTPEMEASSENQLKTIFKNSEMTRKTTLKEIRERLND